MNAQRVIPRRELGSIRVSLSACRCNIFIFDLDFTAVNSPLHFRRHCSRKGRRARRISVCPVLERIGKFIERFCDVVIQRDGLTVSGDFIRVFRHHTGNLVPFIADP